MATKRVKPTSPGRRFQTYATFEEITQTTPEKSLLKNLRKPAILTELQLGTGKVMQPSQHDRFTLDDLADTTHDRRIPVKGARQAGGDL